MNKFVVLEGLSGTGKTTVGKLLAERMGALFYKTPPGPLFSIREEIDRVADNLSRFFFYLSGVVLASSEILKILEEKNVVCDRYIYTTICYHKAFGLGMQVSSQIFEKIILPKAFFLITCHEDVRIQRMAKRGMDANDIAERRLKVDENVLEEYMKYRFIEIDNSSDDPALAVEQILNNLEEI